MKHALLFFIFILCTTSLRGQSSGRGALVISSPWVDSTFAVDIANPDLDLGIHATITNNTAEKIQLKWVRTVKEMPASWETYMYIDHFLCYFPESSTNFDPANRIYDPLEVEAGASLDFALHILPFNVTGNGVFEVSLALTSCPDSIIGKINFSATVRDRTASPSPLYGQSIRIFPNPATDYIMLSSYAQLRRVDIYSMLGRRMRSFDIVDDRSLNISDLPNGLYLVALVDRSGRTVRTLRLSKYSFRP